ncbi:ribose transport system permease protein [Kaistia hirudinis]|uniref:Ribose transport system permease protein n=1 Tax=Kaistia hirudinis TaxID=1293440 RepID=A0A840AYU5_9HYPH|nr:ABC transporter permease [Kaistia hirudinis]MBB3933386.1 ribose transport system permease protein [Kaistia hirudinis]MBN9020387.1 ABC transporter permease [Hyphomicrobiales bacterium]
MHNLLTRFDLAKNIVYIAFFIAIIFFAITLGDRFYSITNILNITRQTAMISIMAVTMTFVISTGQIDLSIGSIAALASLIVALMLQSTENIALSVFVGLGFGMVTGALNGILITALGVPAFLVTLGMMGIIKGLAMWITATTAIPIRVDDYNTIFGLGTVFGIPILFVWTLVALAIGLFVMNYTTFGKKALAVGGNEVAARYSGVNVRNIKIIAMTMSGFTAAFAGILYSGRMQAGRFTFGEGDELTVIAAVILGGTSLFGGTANVFGAVVGSLLIGIINNGLILGGLTVSQQMMVRGVIVILATALGTRGRFFRKKTPS